MCHRVDEGSPQLFASPGRLNFTGKILGSKRAINWIIERVKFIAPVRTYPEQEAIVFAKAGLSVLRGDEKAKTFE